MQTKNKVVLRFSGDSGDGMQLTGGQFSHTSAFMGNDIATFPDFPAEIRAPQGTVAGVSGFQVHFGSERLSTPGDFPDVLVAMNPAALKANIADLKKGATIIVNIDAFTALNFKKAGYEASPLGTPMMSQFQVIEARISHQTKEALKDLELDPKSKARCKNFYALGLTYYMYSRDIEPTERWLREKFKNDDLLFEGNLLALKAGYNFGDTLELHHRFVVEKAQIEKGTYRQINGNTALSYGLIHAAEKAGLKLFLGSYPITPASDILHELSKHKRFGVRTFQAEDEMAAICSAIGASFCGALGLTTSSGPGIALKSEALNLAMMLELPLIVVDVQRGGPSTGLPTKTEQSDLNMVLYGRNGESPIIVIAAKSPKDCFHMAYEAARLSLTHMTPVVFLSDGLIANGSEPWKIPNLDKEYPPIEVKFADPKNYQDKKFYPYFRDEKTLVRPWAIPGTPTLMHRLGGLEKQAHTGNVSYDPMNHETMVKIRQEKVNRIADDIPLQEIIGEKRGDLLIISWGGTWGATSEACSLLSEKKLKVSHLHLSYISPLPKNLTECFEGFKCLLVCELNNGQMRNYLSSQYAFKFESYTKIQGQPFKVKELTDYAEKKLEEINGSNI